MPKTSVKALERELRELRKANEILRLASALLGQGARPWRVSASMRTDFEPVALAQALYARQSERNALVHHDDRARNADSTGIATVTPTLGPRTSLKHGHWT